MLKDEQYIRKLRTLLEVGLALCLAFICSLILWQILAPAEKTLGFASPQARQTGYTQTQNNSFNYAALTQSNPFSPRAERQGQIDAQALKAPETGLNLTLKGIRANGEGQGSAFILLPDNSEKNVSVGDEVLDGVNIEYVFADRVTLRTRGKLETLYWRKPDSQATGLVKPVERAASVPTNSTTPRHAANGQSVTPAELLRSASLAPVREDGKRVGYRLTARGDTTALGKAGLESGDVIRRINNRSVSEYGSEDIIETLHQSRITQIDVERAGKPIRLSVEFAQGTK